MASSSSALLPWLRMRPMKIAVAALFCLVRPLLQLSQWLESVAAERHIDRDAAGHGVSHH